LFRPVVRQPWKRLRFLFYSDPLDRSLQTFEVTKKKKERIYVRNDLELFYLAAKLLWRLLT